MTLTTATTAAAAAAETTADQIQMDFEVITAADVSAFFAAMEIGVDDDVFAAETTFAPPAAAAGPPHSSRGYILTVGQVRLMHHHSCHPSLRHTFIPLSKRFCITNLIWQSGTPLKLISQPSGFAERFYCFFLFPFISV